MKPDSKFEIRNSKQIQNSKHETLAPSQAPFRILGFVLSCLFRVSGTTPGHRRPPAAELSKFEIRISALGVVGVGILLIGGCVAGPERLTVCPGKATVAEALQTLTARAERAVPLRANGQAALTYHVPDRKRPERQGLPGVELRFNPPAEMYLQGSVAVDPKAVIIGSNEREFWLALRPKEISSYYIGQWQDVEDVEGLMMSPQVVLEAVGIMALPGGAWDAGRWTLENKGAYDILTRRNETGRILKRIHVYACDYLVHKIEYFDPRGKVAAVAQLGDYATVAEGFAVPTRIDVVATARDGRQDTMKLDITSPRQWQPNERQRQAFFNPPAADRFEHVYRYEDGQWVPQ
jgi:hypothetical protein